MAATVDVIAWLEYSNDREQPTRLAADRLNRTSLFGGMMPTACTTEYVHVCLLYRGQQQDYSPV